jgi:starch synthase
MDGIEESDLTAVAQSGSFENLSKLAIQYSDAVIQGSPQVMQSVVDYAKESQKLFLPYQDAENYVTSYNQLYDQLLVE